MKKHLLYLLPFILISSLCGCVEKTTRFEKKLIDDDLLVQEKAVDFVNLTDEYEITNPTFDLFFVNNNGVPYISTLDLINGLEGLFDLEDVTFKNSDKELRVTYRYSDTYSCYISVNWYENYIYFDDLDFPFYICKETGATDFSSHFTGTGYVLDNKGVTFDLDKYYFDIFNYQNKCLVPLCIINTLLCSVNYYNLIYNGDTIYGYYGEMDSDDPNYNLIYNKGLLNEQEQSQELRDASYNSLCFMVDYYYGIKEDRNFKNLDNFISATNKSRILSKNYQDNMNGYMGLLYSQFDDLHTRLDSASVYSKKNYLPQPTYNMMGSRYISFWQNYYDLLDLREETLGTPAPVRYIDNTAIITLDSFKTAPNDVLFNKDGSLKEDAWEHDSFYYMKHVMDDISTHQNIDNILLDISVNGGGNIGAMIRVLGFLTNREIPYILYDCLGEREFIYKYLVDIDDDGKYGDDAYDNYHWTLLVSETSYSAANTFASIFQDLNIGKIIGQNTGGGSCSVLPLTLADGTCFTISSNESFRKLDESTFRTSYVSTENGIECDQKLTHPYFYNDQSLSDYINSLY